MPNNADYELVPLTEQERADLAEARITYLVNPGGVDATRARASVAFLRVLAEILDAHGFDHGTGMISEHGGGNLTLTARRIKKAAQ